MGHILSTQLPATPVIWFVPPEPESELLLDALEVSELPEPPYVVVCTSPLSYVLVTVVVEPSDAADTLLGTSLKLLGLPYASSPL